MEEIKSEIKNENISSEQQNNANDISDINSLRQQIKQLEMQLQQKIEQKKITLSSKLTELENSKTQLVTQLNSINEQITVIKKELGIEDNNNSDSEKKVKRTKAKTDSVKQYYSVNGQGKFTSSEIAKKYGIFESYFEYDSNGKITKKLYANWNRFLPIILRGKEGQGYGEMDNGQDRISSVICDKIRKEVRVIDNTTTDNTNTNTSTTDNSNTTTDKELLDELPKNIDNNTNTTDNSNNVVVDNTTQQ